MTRQQPAPAEPERSRAAQLAAAAGAAFYIGVIIFEIDLLTGRHLQSRLALAARGLRYRLEVHQLVPPPPDVSAMLAEARQITVAAAAAREGTR